MSTTAVARRSVPLRFRVHQHRYHLCNKLSSARVEIGPRDREASNLFIIVGSVKQAAYYILE